MSSAIGPNLGYSLWHSDGTKIMTSGAHAPSTNNYCVGLWEKVEHSRYKLNHLTIAWDAIGEHLIGPRLSTQM